MRTLAMLLGGVVVAAAAPPLLTELSPRGAQQGKTLTLTLGGRDLLEGSKVITMLPAVITPLTTGMKGLPYLVELKSDAAPGIYPVRVQNPNGLSNILFFTVGTFAEVAEGEAANDSVATAEAVKATPVTVNGTLKGAERDYFRVAAKAGQRLVFEVEARRAGSAIDPVLELYDAQGALLARNEDAAGIGVDSRMDHTFAGAGDYFVAVHDARFSRQEQNFYRLKIGSYAYADSMFPLGGRRGETVEFEWVSKKAGAVRASVKLPESGSLAMVAMPGSPVLPVPVALSDLAEQSEPVAGALAIPGLVNGRIAKPGEVDKYNLQVMPGEGLLIELQSRELTTSRLDALVTVYDGAGKKLAAAGDQPPVADLFTAGMIGRTQGDPVITLQVPEGVTQLTVAVEDIAQRGGADFAYRLGVRRHSADFQISASPAYLNVPRGGTAQVVVNADRRGYDGAIRATLSNLPKGWSVAGGFIAPEILDSTGARSGSRSGVMTVSVEPDAEMPSGELVVVAEGGGMMRQAAGAGTVIEVAAGTGLPDAASTDRQKSITAAWLNMAMPAAVTNAPVATLMVKPLQRTRMAEGDAFDFEWTIATKNAGVVMPTSLSVNAPGAKDLRVIDMKPTAKGAPTGTFRVTTTKATGAATYDLIVSASLMADGVRETVFSRAIPWQVFEVTEGVGK